MFNEEHSVSIALASRNINLAFAGLEAFGEPNRSASFVSINGQEEFGFGRWMVDRFRENEEIRAELTNWQGQAIHSQGDADIGRVARRFEQAFHGKHRSDPFVA